MSILPYKYFIYFNYLICAAIAGLSFLFSKNLTTSFPLMLLALGLFFIQASSKQVPFPKNEILPVKIVLLITFLFAIIFTFLPQLLSFNNNTELLYTVYICSFLQLVSLFFVKIEEEPQKSNLKL